MLANPSRGGCSALFTAFFDVFFLAGIIKKKKVKLSLQLIGLFISFSSIFKYTQIFFFSNIYVVASHMPNPNPNGKQLIWNDSADGNAYLRFVLRQDLTLTEI